MQRIIPAILTQDSRKLAELLSLFQGQSEWVHIDIMDGVFVPEYSVQISDLGEEARNFNLEIHLMVQNPAEYLRACQEAGAKRVVMHAEADSAVDEAESFAFRKTIALNPETPAGSALPFAKKGWGVMVMGVEPGAQGRPFEPATPEKVRTLKQGFPELVVGADGGVAEENIAALAEAGADYMVIGSRIMNAEDPVAAFKAFERMVH